MIARLNPSNGPCLFQRHARYQYSRRCPEVRGSVSKNHIRGLVNASAVGVDGCVHLENDNTLAETFGFTTNALKAAHCMTDENVPQVHTGVTRRRTHGNFSECYLQ